MTNKDNLVIDVQDISIGYPDRTLLGKELFFSKRSSQNSKKPIPILEDISFQVSKGEVLGIIGRNGCGKTTLLRVISGVLPPLNGAIDVYAENIASMLSVGAGFNPEYSGYDNIIMNASLLGINRKEVKQEIKKILDFADIGDAIHKPIKTYSSGMRARLGFAIYGILKSDLILIDETLSVGDRGFEQKSRNLIDELRMQGRTLVVVSHSLGLLESLCTRIIWLHQGQIIADGRPEKVLEEYAKSFPKTYQSSDQLNNLTGRNGSLELFVDQIEFLDHKRKTVDHLVVGQQTYIRVRFNRNYDGDLAFKNLNFALAFFTETGRKLIRVSTDHVGYEIDYKKDSFYLIVDIGELPINEGSYFMSYRLADGTKEIDNLPRAIDFSVIKGDFYGKGVDDTHSPLFIKHEWYGD